MIPKLIAALIVVIMLASLSAIGIAREEPEFRAMWVSSYGRTCDVASPQGIDRLVADARLANLNALVVQVRKTGDAYYISETEPRAEELEGMPEDWDPLAYLLETAHAAGIEVHAWLNTHKIWQGRNPPKDPNHVYNKRPEWINKTIHCTYDKSGNYGLDPGIREAQEYTFNVFMEVVRNYDVDGVHFDYVRYWDPYFGYTDLAVERFNKETGRTGIPEVDDPEWCQWRRDRVTDLVRQVYEGIHAEKPWVKITAAVVGNHPHGPLPMDFTKSHPYNLLLQDWERWTREGIIDAVIPMNYKREANPQAARAFREWIDGMVRWKHSRHAYNGISMQPLDDYVTQVNETRARGADGTCGFAFNNRRRYITESFAVSRLAERDRSEYIRELNRRRTDRSRMALALRQTVFQDWVPTPPMPWKPPRPSGGPKAPSSSEIDRIMYHTGVNTTLTYLEEFIEKNPDHADAHFRLGRLYRLKGMDSEAQARFRDAVRLDPNHYGAPAEL